MIDEPLGADTRFGAGKMIDESAASLKVFFVEFYIHPVKRFSCYIDGSDPGVSLLGAGLPEKVSQYGGNTVQDRDLFFADPFTQAVCAFFLEVEENARGSCEKAAVNVHIGCTEAEGEQQREPVVGGNAEIAGVGA